MAVSRFMETAASRDYSKFWAQEHTFPWMIQQKKAPLPKRDADTRENYLRTVKGEKPFFIPLYGHDTNTVWPDAVEEHPVPEVDGFDWWGVEWEMVETAGGMITKTGTRVITDFSKWEEQVPWPDLSVVDFKADGAKIAANLDPERIHIFESTEGLFERLHEMMPFDESLLAFYEYPEELESFFRKMADYKIEVCENVFKYYGQVDGVLYHDDWGSQRAGFFSNEMFREQIMPATKLLTDYIRGQGKFLELHSCGRNMQYIPEMIELGFDMWAPQWNANDPEYIYENFGDKMTFPYPLRIEKDMDEQAVRQAVRDFVEHYGPKGRAMAQIMASPEQRAVAADELYTYSLAFYSKLFGRE